MSEMFFYLSKIMYFFLVPTNWIILFLVAGLFSKRRKWKKRLLVLGTASLIIFTNPFIFNVVSKTWEGRPTPIPQIKGHYDYALVLGGFSDYIPELGNQYVVSERGNRLISTIYLYKRGNVDKIFISGGSGNIWQKRPPEAKMVRDFLVESGIPKGDIIIEYESRNTYENALFSKKIIEEINPDAKCILITSAFHMPRAMGLFQKQGLDVTGYPTDFFAETPNSPDRIFLPSARVLKRWEVLIKEWVGIIVYKLKGDI